MNILTNVPFNYTGTHDVRCPDGVAACRSQYNPGNQVSREIVEALGARGFNPDFFIFRSPNNHPMPHDIEVWPIITVALLDDWFGSIEIMADQLRRFDYTFTDRASVDLLAELGYTTAAYWPCFGYNPDRFRILPGIERSLDVSFCGSLNINIQRERLSSLRTLASIPDPCAIKIFHGMFGDNYVRVLNQSRMVFNRTIKGEMNLRAFEAPACGALLLIEESNREVRDFLEPGSECVIYNEQNLRETITDLMAHPEKVQSIAKAGHLKIKRYTESILFDRLIDTLCSQNLVAGQNRRQPFSYFSFSEHAVAVQAALSFNGVTSTIVQQIFTLVNNPQPSERVINDCAVMLLAYSVNHQTVLPMADLASLISVVTSLFDFILQKNPANLVAKFNKIQLLMEKCLHKEAELLCSELQTAVFSNQSVDFSGLIYPLHYRSPHRYLWSWAISSSIPDQVAIAQKRHTVLRFFALLRLAEIFAAREDYGQAKACYSRADSLIPNHPAPATGSAMLPSSDGDLILQAIALNPFNNTLWIIWVKYLKQNGRMEEAKQFVADGVRCLRRMQFADEKTIEEFERLIEP